jgi:HEAT repeat protein
MRIYSVRFANLLACLALARCGLSTTVSYAGTSKPKVVKADVAALVAVLNGADSDAAANAMTQLGAMDSPSAHDAILDGLAFGPNPSVVIAALPALMMHPSPADTAVLIRYARYRGVKVRVAAINALAGYPDPQAKQALVRGLRDSQPTVRAAAAAAIGKARVRDAVPALEILLERGDLAAASALGQMADVEMARTISDKLGQVPDDALATCLGAMLKRDDFGPDTARVQVVTAIGKISSNDAITVLTDYIESTPKNPPRPSRKEAEAIVEARLGGK